MAETRTRRLARIEAVAVFAFSAAVLLQAVAILADRATYQWDLVAYARGVTLFGAGQNPYDVTAFAQPLAGSENVSASHLPFVYTPASIPLFQLLFAGGFRAAYVAFLLVKLLLLVGAGAVWSRSWVHRDDRALFLLFAIVAFNGCVTTDIAAGNVATYEAFWIAIAFVFFVRARFVPFALCVVAASFFKLTPLALLAPLAFAADGAAGAARRARFTLAGAVALVVLAGAFAYGVAPALHRAFVHAAFALGGGTGERAFQNPSSWALVSDAVHALRPRDALASEPVALALYTLWVCVVVGTTAVALRRASRNTARSPDAARAFALTLTCLAYALVLPRFKDYAYVLVLAPFVASLHRQRLSVRTALVAVGIFPGDAVARAISPSALTQCPVTPAWLALAYLPWASVAMAWALHLARAGVANESSTSRVTPSGPTVNLAG